MADNIFANKNSDFARRSTNNSNRAAPATADAHTRSKSNGQGPHNAMSRMNVMNKTQDMRNTSGGHLLSDPLAADPHGFYNSVFAPKPVLSAS